jgi:membrane protease YdiL (CAAX protease family)
MDTSNSPINETHNHKFSENETNRKRKILITLEVLFVFVVFLAVRVAMRSTSLVQRERLNLGWTYTVMFVWIGITVLVMFLTRRGWAAYGISSANWQTNLDIGIKAYLVRIIPIVLGGFGAVWMGLNPQQFSGKAFSALTWVIALALMVWLMNRQKEVKSGRANLLVTLLMLLVPIAVALAVGKLSLVIVSTVFWQFVLSGFGEELIYRGYFQSRLNQAFRRPVRLFGIQFGAGLVIASLLFGLLHVTDSYDPALGLSSLAWDLLVDNFLAGLFLGVIYEKTGTLLASGIAHGLPDAVGEPLMILFDWREIFY